ncbi:MAG: tetratricopeptide repeat protein [Bacteroidales bacterium]|nr:tetratricopeptide repeat protein [Bacteroidales bacterium]
MEEEKYRFSREEEISRVVQRFERMKRNNENYFFDVIEFETIIDYYLERNNQTKALEAASIASRQHPNSVPIQLRNAKVLLDRGKTVEAMKILKRLENIEPGNHEIFIAKGTALGMMGDIAGAMKMFDTALTKDSDDIENILYSVTSVLQSLNYFDQVIPFLERLIDLEPYYAPHLYDIAFACEKVHDFEKSIKYYQQYLDSEPFADNAWFNLGMVYSRLERFTEALDAYEYALAINPDNDFALFNKGIVLSSLERFDEAAQVYLEYLAQEPESYEAMTYLAECYEKTSRFKLARKYFYEAIELAPEFADAWIGLGITELDEGNLDKSLKYLKKASEADPDNPEIWLLTGKVLNRKGNKKQAVRCLRETLKLDPYINEAWLEMGLIILEGNFGARTLSILKKVRKIIGDFPGIDYLLAAISLHTGNSREALSYLRKALELDSEAFYSFSVLFGLYNRKRAIRNLLDKYNLK